MSKKFPYKDFSKESVIQSANSQQLIMDQNVLGIISKHFQNIITNQTPAEGVNESTTIMSGKDNIVEKFFTSKLEIIKEKEQSFQQGYQKGYENAKNEASALLAQHPLDYNFLQKLAELTKIFNPNNVLVEDYVNLIGVIIEIVIKKMSLSMPVDFSKIIKQQLNTLINSCYERGEVIIRIHPAREAFVKEMLQQQSSNYQVDQINFMIDNKLDENDCVLEYKETKLVYDFDHINKEIAEIIDQFKINSSNKE